MPAAPEPSPVTPGEARSLFQVFETRTAALLAVSGGSDSMALMWLAARWARDTGWPCTLHVAVVDHGLRPEAADEASFVLREAAKLGLNAHKLSWTGPHPETGIPAAAREARYGLLLDLARQFDAVVVTGHTQDDQAETVLMRLARGSGVDGLSAMAVHTRRDGMQLFRPLLELSRERLRATLRQAGVGWIDDPTNENKAHERVRIRQALDVLDGLGVTREAIALSAQRLGRARSALELSTSAFIHEAVHIEANAYAIIDHERWLLAPREVRTRAVLSLARSFGGGSEASLSGADALVDWFDAGTGRARTFAGCTFVRRKHAIIVGREPSRVPAGLVCVGGDGAASVVWDNRYRISVSGNLAPARVVPVSGCEGLERPRDLPDFVWRGLPAVLTPKGAITPFDIESGDNESRGGVEFRFINLPSDVHDDA